MSAQYLASTILEKIKEVVIEIERVAPLAPK